MAQAKKLSEALSELSNDSSISGDERIVVSDTDGVARTIPAKQLFASAQVSTMGSYNIWSECLSALDEMATNSSVSGKYVAKVGGTPYYVTFVICSKEKNVFWQMIEGGIVVKSDGTLATDTSKYVTFASRYYENGAWSVWQESAKKSDIPIAQSGTSGTNKNYVYSVPNSGSHEVLSGTFKCYQYNGKIRMTHKLWGSTTDYSDGMYHSADFPVVNSSADGAMDHYVHSRILNHTLVEANSTTDAVKVNYTNFSASGNKTLTLTAATSAKAGVMTVAQVKMLSNVNSRVADLESTEASKRLGKIESHYKDLGHFDTETDALNKITDLSVCADENLLHAHLTYTLDDGSQSSLILVQEIEGKWTRQIIINHTKIFQRTLYFKTTERTELDWKENWSYLFCDRLTWNNSERKYIPSQFGESFNSEYTDQIPLASSSVDGLMSKEDKALLEKIKKQLNL